MREILDHVQLQTVWDRENVFAVSRNTCCGEDKGSYQGAALRNPAHSVFLKCHCLW